MHLTVCYFSLVTCYTAALQWLTCLPSEFGTDEYKAAKVDPINQFSAPVAVLWPFEFLIFFGFMAQPFLFIYIFVYRDNLEYIYFDGSLVLNSLFG